MNYIGDWEEGVFRRSYFFLVAFLIPVDGDVFFLFSEILGCGQLSKTSGQDFVSPSQPSSHNDCNPFP